MAYHHKITADKILENLQKRIDEDGAELAALQGVKINTDHKTLTNKAVTGDGARIGEYLGINKALYLSYAIKYIDGHIRYDSTNFIAYSYEDENGAELGTVGCVRISRTVTPKELAETVRGIIEAKKQAIAKLKSDYRRAETIAKQQNALIDKIDKFNNTTSYASEAQI